MKYEKNEKVYIISKSIGDSFDHIKKHRANYKKN